MFILYIYKNWRFQNNIHKSWNIIFFSGFSIISLKIQINKIGVKFLKFQVHFSCLVVIFK